MKVRKYLAQDCNQVAALYKDGALYGGQFDEARDSESRLKKRIEADPDSILVAETGGRVVGTVSLIEDGRVAMLFRFAVGKDAGPEVGRALCDEGLRVLREKGHAQALVYAPSGDAVFEARYTNLGFTKGSDYTCYWKDIGK